MNDVSRSLRDYQSSLLTDARRELASGFKSIMIQLVTGGGKTRMVASAIKRAINWEHPETKKRQTVWFIVPRSELLWQSSKEFLAWKIRHGMITSELNESSAFRVHIVSRDTLRNRIKQKRIKKWPDQIHFDEAHLALDQQLFVKQNAPPDTIFLGWTATPEKLDGRGLNEMYETIVQGPSLQWMCEHDFLKRPWVLSVPPSERIQGLDKAEYTKTGDLKKKSAQALNEAYQARAINGISYGNEIEHYRKFGIGRSFLVFCRSLDQCKTVAEEFRKSSFRVEDIDGTMSDRERQEKIRKVKDGELDGLTTRDLVTYGLDVPKISCIIMLRPTASVALFFQMIGRGLRPDRDFENCLILDHVGNCDEKNHGHPLAPREWNFIGNIKKKKTPKDAVVPLVSYGKCEVCFRDLGPDKVCDSCGHINEIKTRKLLKQVDGWLVEITEPTPLKERPLENQRYYQDMISNNVDRFRNSWYGDGGKSKGVVDREAVKNLLDAAHDLKWKNAPMQVFYMLTRGDLTVNVSLLSEIAEIKGYHALWVSRKREELEARLKNKYYDIIQQDEARERKIVNY